MTQVLEGLDLKSVPKYEVFKMADPNNNAEVVVMRILDGSAKNTMVVYNDLKVDESDEQVLNIDYDLRYSEGEDVQRQVELVLSHFVDKALRQALNLDEDGNVR
jgi:hypothetical protein